MSWNQLVCRRCGMTSWSSHTLCSYLYPVMACMLCVWQGMFCLMNSSRHFSDTGNCYDPRVATLQNAILMCHNVTRKHWVVVRSTGWLSERQSNGPLALWGCQKYSPTSKMGSPQHQRRSYGVTVSAGTAPIDYGHLYFYLTRGLRASRTIFCAYQAHATIIMSNTLLH